MSPINYKLMSEKSTPLAPNTTLYNNTFIIESVLGKNEFGVTYLATQNGESDFVCVLQYCPQNIADEELEASKQKFVEDARVLANFDHENIVKVLALFAENDVVYMVIPFIEKGLTQKEFLKVSNELPLYIPEMIVTKEYLQSQGIADELLPRKPHFLHLPDYKVILVHFGAVQVFSNEIEEKEKVREEKTPPLPQPERHYGTESSSADPQSPKTGDSDFRQNDETETVAKPQKYKAQYAALACPACKRPLPICVCQKIKTINF